MNTVPTFTPRPLLLAPRRMLGCCLFLGIGWGCGDDSASTGHPDDTEVDAAQRPDAGATDAGGEADAGNGGGDAGEFDAGPGEPDGQVDASVEVTLGLALSEVMAKNDGAWIDGVGETDDWIEVVNRGDLEITLRDYVLRDASGNSVRLPQVVLAPGEVAVLWADDTETQGPLHLPFKLDADADGVTLLTITALEVDSVQWTQLQENESMARFGEPGSEWERCRYATPGRENGTACAPPAAPEPPPVAEFSPFSFPDDFAEPKGPLVLNELALRPAEDEPAFFEVTNSSEDTVDLADYQVRLSTHRPGLAWPDATSGQAVPLPALVIESGGRVAVRVAADLLTELASDTAFEGVLTIFDAAGEVVDRVDFMRWPVAASLTRIPDGRGLFRYCNDVTEALENTCQMPVLSRDVGDRVRHLRTPGDFEALAKGATEIGIDSVKFVLDMEAGGVVHLLGSERWPLHYTFVRELIYGQPELDRCDEAQADEFYQGWVEFSQAEYFRVEGRRFLLGTLSLHGSTGLQAVEYTQGDAISGPQMVHGFMNVVPHTQDPTAWVLHPHDAAQAQTALTVDGQLPIVDPNAPYQGLTYQPLTEGVAYGTLRFVPVDQLDSVPLGPDVIVVTDDVPNDIPLVGGLITEAFQTPLAHVNVLSQNRGTPNAALKDARNELAPYLEKLVRWEVRGAELSIEEADPAEAQAFWESRIPEGPTVAPRLDTSLRGVQPLTAHDLSSLPQIGAKASQLAELARVDVARAGCSASSVPINVPSEPFAVPLVHSLEHFEASGARALLAARQELPEFAADPIARAAALAEVRQAILDFPLDADLLDEVETAVRDHFGQARLRFRSSSNTEDLPGFNGAGLYTSVAAEVDSDADRIDDAIRTVWASLWNARAYDERRYARIDDSSVAMGVLVHPAYVSEQANGVAVSRNVLDPSRGDIFYINAQAGEASVTNPAPSVTTEQLVFRWGRTPKVMYNSQSSLLKALDEPLPTVLSETEAEELSCALAAVHDWFRPLLDPDQEDPWFAMEVEFKLMGVERTLAIKQARPHSFANRTTFGDCREL